MARRLKLQKFELQNISYLWTGAFRLRVEASDPLGSGADPHVFLFQRHPPNPYNGDVDDEWIGVASAVDIAEFPVGEPNTNTAYPFFRLNFLEVDLRQAELANKVWLIIQDEVHFLLVILDILEKLVPTEEVWVGTLGPTPPESGSSGSSESTSA